MPARVGHRRPDLADNTIATHRRRLDRELDRLLDLKPTDVEGSHLRATIDVTARDKLLVFLTRRDVEATKATTRFLDQQGMLPPKPIGRDNILDHLSVAIDPHESLRSISDFAKGFSIVLDQLGLKVIHNKTDISFLTSDNPVVYFDPTMEEPRLLPYQVQPPHGSIELLFPIDADTIVRGRPGPPNLRHVPLRIARTLSASIDLWPASDIASSFRATAPMRP
jgi:hypothetical protein